MSRVFLQYSLRGLYTGGGGLHLYIHEDDLAIRRVGQRDGLRTGGRLPHNAHVLLRRERVAQILADYVKILRNQYVYHFPCFPSRRVLPS